MRTERFMELLEEITSEVIRENRARLDFFDDSEGETREKMIRAFIRRGMESVVLEVGRSGIDYGPEL